MIGIRIHPYIWCLCLIWWMNGCGPKEVCVPPVGTPDSLRVKIEDLCVRDPARRAQAAIDLGLMGRQAKVAVPFLINTLEDCRALQWGCSHGGETTEKHGITVSPGDRAAIALAAIANSSETREYVIDALGIALSDPSMSFRGHANAVLALGKMDSPQTIPLLIQALSHPQFPVRLRAVDALAGLDDPRVAPALTQALDDDNEKVRDRAQAVLKAIQSATP